MTSLSWRCATTKTQRTNINSIHMKTRQKQKFTAIAILVGMASFVQTALADPAKIGDEVAQIYIQTFVETADLLKGSPPAEEIAKPIAELKEKQITRLVELGKKIEGMSAADKAVVQSKVSAAYRDPKFKEAFAVYSAERNKYIDDKELYANLKSFNILTQYAFFDLLRKQAPEEAERLGVAG